MNKLLKSQALTYACPTALTPRLRLTLQAVAIAFAIAIAIVTFTSTPTFANNLGVSPAQQSAAQQAAAEGIALSELAPNAPDSYMVKQGDTLWAISKIFLKSPWRWPELWGMNMADIKNPHLIYPSQTLYLDKSNGRARLSSQRSNGDSSASTPNLVTIKVPPFTRVSRLADAAIPTLQNNLIEPFLSEPIIVEETSLEAAPRFVATREGRVLLSQGDRGYARSASGNGLAVVDGGNRRFRVFRNATPLKDPSTNEVLGYEAQYIGRAQLVRPETVEAVRGVDFKAGETAKTDIVPATLDITRSKEEIRAGDRLLPEPPIELLSYSPRASAQRMEARVVSVYGSSVANGAQNQIVVINRGVKDGVERGQVLAIQSNGERLVDKTGATWQDIKLPDERNGLLMVFRPFEKLSYALILEAKEPVRVGDWLINPR